MRSTTAIAIINSAIWVSSCVAIGLGLYFTQDIKCLWFLIIPACSGYVTKWDKSQIAEDNSIQIQGESE